MPNLTRKEIKQRYFKKVYDAAPLVDCACGCGQQIKNRDEYGREKLYISGHNNRKYPDKNGYKRAWNHRNRPARYQLKQDRGRRLKRKLIYRRGGRCTGPNCPIVYDETNGCLFDFHHRDPATKEFAITQRTLNAYAFERLKRESDKCDLICSNCHRLHHGEPF